MSHRRSPRRSPKVCTIADSTNVYFDASQTSLTITLPAGTAAFYLYLEQDNFGTSPFTVTARDGEAADTTSSGPVSLTTPSGAGYFGFYATGGQTIWSVSITGPVASDGIGVGEFGIAALPAGPAATTESTSNVTSSSAQLAGTVNPNGTMTTSYFEYGTTAHYGQVAPSPAAADGNGTMGVAVSASIADLQPGTTYHDRLIAVNAYGETAYGADKTFTTAIAPPAPAPPAPLVPAPAKHCLVPSLSHLSPGAAKTALTHAGCTLGKVKKRKRPKHTRGLSYGVVAESPATGTTVALGTKVSVTLGWFKRPTHPKHKS